MRILIESQQKRWSFKFCDLMFHSQIQNDQQLYVTEKTKGELDFIILQEA